MMKAQLPFDTLNALEAKEIAIRTITRESDAQ